MIIDSAVQDFLEKYDREAIVSIAKFATDEVQIRNKYNLNLFGITEAFARFDQLLSNWGKTNIKKLIKEGTDYTLQDATYEVSGFINSELIKDKNIYVQDFPDFIESYLNGVNKISESVEKIKIEMIKNRVPNENIGIINEFVDKFMEKVNPLFYKGMDEILWATGYTYEQKKKIPVTQEPQNIII